MTNGKWIGLSVLVVTEIMLIFSVIVDRNNLITYATIQAGIFAGVWGAVSISKFKKPGCKMKVPTTGKIE